MKPHAPHGCVLFFGVFTRSTSSPRCHFFESLHLVMHWSDSKDPKRIMVLQTVLVMNIFSSLVSATHSDAHIFMLRTSSKVHRIVAGYAAVAASPQQKKAQPRVEGSTQSGGTAMAAATAQDDRSSKKKKKQ